MAEPSIDPITGQSTQSPPPTPPDYVPKSDFDALRNRLDAFETAGFGGGGNQQQFTPPTPSGPSFDDQIAGIDRQIDSLDAAIDSAVEDGKPVSKLMRERDKLNSSKIRMEVNREIEPRFAQGVEVINQLTGEVTRGQMPHYDIVQKDVEAHLRQLPADQRMNPQVRKAAYQLAVGQNVDKIMAAQKEEILRSAAADLTAAPSGANGRSTGTQYSANIPDPKKLLGADAMTALRNKGITIDQEMQRRGYQGYEDWYNKVGKDYFGEDN